MPKVNSAEKEWVWYYTATIISQPMPFMEKLGFEDNSINYIDSPNSHFEAAPAVDGEFGPGQQVVPQSQFPGVDAKDVRGHRVP